MITWVSDEVGGAGNAVELGVGYDATDLWLFLVRFGRGRGGGSRVWGCVDVFDAIHDIPSTFDITYGIVVLSV